MIISLKASTYFKTAAYAVVISFLWQQVSWAGDLLESSLEHLNTEQSQTFAPSYLQKQQSVSENLISQKQSIEDAINSERTATAKATEPSDEDTLPVKGLRTSGSAAPRLATRSVSGAGAPYIEEGLSASDGNVISVTTQTGDVITYKDGAIDSIRKKDGTVLSNIVVDENDNLREAEITYLDGTIELISGGKITKITRPDGTIYNYNADESIHSVVYPDSSTCSYSYTKDAQGKILETVLTDSEKVCHYNSDNKLTKVIFNDGKTIEYDNGIITRATDPDGAVYSYDTTENTRDGATTYLARLKTIVDSAGVRYDITDSNITGVVLKDKSITNLGLDEDGKIVNGTIEYLDGTKIVIENKKITKITDAGGITTAYRYSPDGLQCGVTIDDHGSVKYYTYTKDPATGQYTIKGASGTYEYDALWNLEKFTCDLGSFRHTYSTEGSYAGSVFTSTDGAIREYDATKRLVKTTFLGGTVAYYVYSGESIQAAIDTAKSGDTIFVHSGVYHEHIVLSSGVNIIGDYKASVIINGDYQTNSNVIRALGNNRIENITVSGGGYYSGSPSSAIRVEGDNVSIRNNNITDNRDYAVHIWSGTNTLIEKNFFKGNGLGVQLPNSGTTIQYNTFVNNNMAINVLNGPTPIIRNNVITGSTFQSIYEFSWAAYAAGLPASGYAIVEGNILYNNTEHGGYYCRCLPPAVLSQTSGNLISDPLYVDPASGNYSVPENSPAFGKGAFLSQALSDSLDNASGMNLSDTIYKLNTYSQMPAYALQSGAPVIFPDGKTDILYNTTPDIRFPVELPDRNTAYFDTITYDQNRAIKEILKADGEKITYRNGLVDTILSGNSSTHYSYTLSGLDNIAGITIDRDGIKRIYDTYGNLQGISLSDATRIVYADGKVQEIEKADGTIIKNMTFKDSGELDSALVSYPDGSVAVYQDAKLLQIIGQGGGTVDYLDGKIRHVTLDDGSVYDWFYDGTNIVILDESRQEKRTYLEGRLIQLEELGGTKLITKYYYGTASNNLTKTEVRQNGEVLYTYTYTYEAGLTLIHDEDGNTQAYTRDKKLSYIIDSTGKKYSYTYVGKNEGYIEVYFPSASKVRYDSHGNIIDIIESDGTVIKDVVLSANNVPDTFAYIKDGDTYKVVGGQIKEVLSKDGTRTVYYDNGLTQSVETALGELTQYQYFVKDSKAFSDASIFLSGSLDKVSFYNSGNTTYLELSKNTLQFGTGVNGAKHVSADETLSAGTYNFTSLTIDAGKTLKIAPGAIVNILGRADINGAIFCGGTFNMNAYDINVASGASITAAVNIKCNTINNAGIITGNACLTGTRSGGSENIRDDDFATAVYNDYWGDGDVVTVMFHECDISAARYQIAIQGFGLTSSAAVYICTNGNWVNLLSYTSPAWGAMNSGVVNNTAGWSNVTGIMMTGQSGNGNCVSSSYALYEMQALIGTPTIEYVIGNPGVVNTTPSRPTATIKQNDNPSSGTFESAVIKLDAIDLGSLSWSQELPIGTNITFQTRTGDTITPDATWSGWSAEQSGGASSQILSPKGKYIQYRMKLSTTDPNVTPLLKLGSDNPITFDYSRAPIGADELSALDHATVLKNGITSAYDKNGLRIWRKGTDGVVTHFSPPNADEPLVLSGLAFDPDYLNGILNKMPAYVLNDTQKQIYLKDSIIISELTAIRSVDGTVTEYCQGQISKITKSDGTVINDISFNSDNAARDYTYIKDGNTYVVKDGLIDTVITQAGETIKYYSYGLMKSAENTSSERTYDYGVETVQSYTTNLILRSGAHDSTSFLEQGNTTYLELSKNTLQFGTGVNGAKHVSADETLSAGTYNFTSLTIDAGKTLKIAPGAIVNILGRADINGAIFSGGTFAINAYEVNVASGASITGAVNIKCNTIHNSGIITGNACLTGAGSGRYGNTVDDNFATGVGNYVWGMSDAVSVSFPSCDITRALYRASLGNYGLPAYASVYLCVNGSWVCIASYAGSGDSGVVNNTTGWSNVTGMMMTGQSLNGDCVSSSYMLWEMQAIIGTATIEYVNGDPGAVNTTASKPTAVIKQNDNPSSGTFESAVIKLDAIDLGSLSWSQELPIGTSITFQTRTGDTATPDSTWSDWSAPLTDSAASKIMSQGKKYFQFKINMSSTDPAVTPRVILDATHAISIGYTKISDNPSDVYVKVKSGGITKTYNKNGINITDPTDTIDIARLSFNSTYLDALTKDIPDYRLSDAQKIITIYDQGNDTPVEIVTAGQSITYFENGLATKVVDKDGTVQVVYTYDSDKNIIDVRFVDARQKLTTSYNEAVAQIVVGREEALARLESSEADNRASIASQSASALAQVNTERQRLTLQMSLYDPAIYDLSAFTNAFAELDSYQTRLTLQTADAYANLSLQIASARVRVEADASTAMQNLISNDYNKILADIVQKESSPIIYQYYRKILGRDPDESDLTYWTDRAKAELVTIAPSVITHYLQDLPEYTARQTRKANIINSLTTFFSRYLAASMTEKEAMLTAAGLNTSDAVTLTRSDIDAILSWLNGQSLHFGDSAIQSVVSILKTSGINKSFEDIGEAALAVDILTGVITKDTTGDLLLSMYAMRKAAAVNGLDLSSQKIDLSGLKREVVQGGLITHIDGKHYVIVTAIDETSGTVTYTDSTVGENGQSITISTAEFMEVWKGFALSKEPAPAQAKELNVTQEKNIRGSGWWTDFWKGIVGFFQRIVAPIGALLLFTPLAPLGAILLGINIVIQTISFVVRTGTLMDIAWAAITAIGSAIGSAVLPGIYTAAGNIFQSIGTMIPVAIRGVFTSCLSIFNPISIAVKGISTGIGAIFNPILGEAVTQLLTANVIKIGVELGSNFLFTNMGLDPSLSSIGSALFSGAVSGMGTAGADVANIVADALKYGTIAGINTLGIAVNLDSNITRLAGMLSGALVGGALSIDGREISYTELMDSVSPDIEHYCSSIGLTGIGNILGIDPRISYLAGVGLRSTLNMGLSEGFEPAKIWGSVSQGLLQGVTNIGLNFATQELDLNPLLANIGFSAISGAINAGIQAATGGSQNVFQTLFQTYEKNALTFLGYADPNSPGYAWQQATYISQILDFSDIVRERGLVEALNTYGAGFFNAVAVNNIVQSGYTLGGYFADKLQAGQYADRTLQDGKQVKEVLVKDAEGTVVGKVFFQQKQVGEQTYWDIVGREDVSSSGSYLGWGDLGVDAYGRLGYTEAELYSIFNSDIQYQRVVGGQQAYAEVKDSLGNTLLIIEPTAGGHYNVYNSYGDYMDAKINTLLSGKTYSFDDALLKYYQELDSTNSTSLFDVDLSNPDAMGLLFNSLSLSSSDIAKYNFTPEQIQQMTYVILGGIDNPCPEGLSAPYMRGFETQLAIADPSGATIRSIGMYPWSGWTNSNSTLDNSIAWICNAYLGSHELTNDVITGMQMQFGSQMPSNMTGIAYSGGGDPYIQAINENPDWDVNAIVLVNAPLGYGRIITNPNVNNVIMIGGTKDPLAEQGFMNQGFDNNPRPLNVYKIALNGVGHTQFSYDPTEQNPDPKAVLASRFSAEMAVRGNSTILMQDFIDNQIQEGSMRYDTATGIYFVDLEKVKYEN